MVQKKYSVHKISVEVQTEPTTVIQAEGFSDTSKRQRNPKTPQYIAASAVTVSAFSLGTVLGWSSTSLPSVQKSGHFPGLVTTDLSWIGSLITIGAVAGAPLAGYCIERYGRKNTLHITSISVWPWLD